MEEKKGQVGSGGYNGCTVKKEETQTKRDHFGTNNIRHRHARIVTRKKIDALVCKLSGWPCRCASVLAYACALLALRFCPTPIPAPPRPSSTTPSTLFRVLYAPFLVFLAPFFVTAAVCCCVLLFSNLFVPSRLAQG